MAEYSTDDTFRAEDIASRLFQPERLDRIELEESLSIADVEQDTLDFTQQVNAVESVGQRVPAARTADDELVPIDIRTLVPFEDVGPDVYPYGQDRAYRWLRELYERRYPTIPTVTPDEARTTFRFRLVEFLATRIAGVRGLREGQANGAQAMTLHLPPRLGAQPAPAAGCTFVVSTNSSGLNAMPRSVS